MDMGGRHHAPGRFSSQERPGTHCTGGWVGPRAGLHGCGKSRPPPGFDSRTAQPVASRYTDWDIAAPRLMRSDSEILIGRLSMKTPVGVAIIISINIDIYYDNWQGRPECLENKRGSEHMNVTEMGISATIFWDGGEKITYSECVFVALGIQHAMRLCHIFIRSLPIL